MVREEKVLTTREMCTLTILAGSTSFFPFDPVGIFIGRFFDLVVICLTSGHIALGIGGRWTHVV